PENLTFTGTESDTIPAIKPDIRILMSNNNATEKPTATPGGFALGAIHQFVKQVNIPSGAGASSTVLFTDSTMNTKDVAWKWTFPGGTPSTATTKAVNVLYSTPGIYDVILETTTEKNVTDSIRMKYAVNVHDPN